MHYYYVCIEAFSNNVKYLRLDLWHTFIITGNKLDLHLLFNTDLNMFKIRNHFDRI